MQEHHGTAPRCCRRNPWLTVGAECTVLEIFAQPSGRIELHLPTDSPGDLGWFPSKSFVTADDSIPTSWVTQIDDGGNARVGPKAWFSPGFWERFYDGEEAAWILSELSLRRSPAACSSGDEGLGWIGERSSVRRRRTLDGEPKSAWERHRPGALHSAAPRAPHSDAAVTAKLEERSEIAERDRL